MFLLLSFVIGQTWLFLWFYRCPCWEQRDPIRQEFLQSQHLRSEAVMAAALLLMAVQAFSGVKQPKQPHQWPLFRWIWIMKIILLSKMGATRKWWMYFKMPHKSRPFLSCNTPQVLWFWVFFMLLFTGNWILINASGPSAACRLDKCLNIRPGQVQKG